MVPAGLQAFLRKTRFRWADSQLPPKLYVRFQSFHFERDVAHFIPVAAVQLTSGLIDGAVSGIMGLAWTPLAATRSPPFWLNLVGANALTNTDMSFYFTRQIDNPRAPTQTFGGVFTLGGTNSTLYTGDIEFLTMPVQTPSFWLLGLSCTSAFSVMRLKFLF